MFNLKSLVFWKYALIILLFPVVVNFMLFQRQLPWVFGTADNWLSFWGNYTGGLISAFVAYFIANSQIEKQRIINQHEKTIAQLPSLMRIRIELNKYILELRRVNQERAVFVLTEDIKGDFDIQAEGPFLSKYTILLFKEENYSLLEKIEDDDLHIKLISCFEFYDDFSKTISLDMYSNKDDNFYQMQTISKKQNVWERFYEESQLSIFEQVLDEVSKEIADIQKKKEKENTTRY
ncbi:hypothetical protein [Peribacillus frigoritolerans]|uniref:hypothetical protein n=1 Tax=Peribacillus frigoritolerans TaxID=450367 RepID=UPI001F4FF254|nr:hypothetical protein [Peribacillus frigoritolerans]MCK2020773.1 hypothetical protein [Peribacillus frigoritolerans]